MKKITEAVAEELHKMGFKPTVKSGGKNKKREPTGKEKAAKQARNKLQDKVLQEKISAEIPESDVDKLSTLAEVFSAIGPKNVDNLIKYEVLTEVIYNQNVFHNSSEFALLITLMVLEFTRGVNKCIPGGIKCNYRAFRAFCAQQILLSI